MSITQSLKKPILLWCLASMFFAFQFIIRLTVGILREEIMQKFAIDTIAFGTLAGYYYLGYAGMQIPVGIMLDKWNFKYVSCISIAVTSLGALAFVMAEDWRYLLAARFIIGAGSAAGFLTVAKITKVYFPAKYHSLLLGLSFTFGLSGAVFGVAPMKFLFNHFGYDFTFYVLIVTGLTISLIMLLVNTSAEAYEQESKNIHMQAIKLLFNPTILLIGISGGLMVGALEGFADVWAIPFFREVFNMSMHDSGLVTSFIYIGMCVGGPILALLADLCKSSNLIVFLTGVFTIVIFLMLFYSSGLSFTTGAIIMFFLGICCCYQVLVFSIVTNMVDKAAAALSIAIVNCLNMSFGHFFHKAMSILIEYKWDKQVNDCNLPIYARQDFINSLSVIPICCFIGMLGFVYLAWGPALVNSCLRNNAGMTKKSNLK